jgi:hypothetical protein
MSHLPGKIETMKEDRMRAGDADRDRLCDAHEDGLDARGADAPAEDANGWQQPQLIPAPALNGSHRARPSDRLRDAGLVGIAQAREALAEAARRAKARSESRAA